MYAVVLASHTWPANVAPQIGGRITIHIVHICQSAGIILYPFIGFLLYRPPDQTGEHCRQFRPALRTRALLIVSDNDI